MGLRVHDLRSVDNYVCEHVGAVSRATADASALLKSMEVGFGAVRLQQLSDSLLPLNQACELTYGLGHVNICRGYRSVYVLPSNSLRGVEACLEPSRSP